VVEAGIVQLEAEQYFQSMCARTASAACRSGRFYRNWKTVTSARRQGGSPG
jgi:hypothetical protein